MNRLTVVLVLILTSSAFSAPMDPDVYRPPATVKRRKRPDAKTVNSLVAEVVRLTAALDSMPELSKERIESVLGVTLGPSTSDPPEPYGYDTVLRRGPFASVHFRHSKPDQAASFSILSLGVRDNLHLSRRDFDEALVGPQTSSQGDSVPATNSHSMMTGADRRRSFTFEMGSGALLGVSFFRGTAAKNR